MKSTSKNNELHLLTKIRNISGVLGDTTHSWESALDNEYFTIVLTNKTQIFKSKFKISGTDMCIERSNNIDFFENMKQKYLRTLIEQLEYAVIYGGNKLKGITDFVESKDIDYKELSTLAVADNYHIFVPPSLQLQGALICQALKPNHVLVLDCSDITLYSLRGRSFHFKPLASDDDYEQGMIIGEYTLEVRNPKKHYSYRVKNVVQDKALLGVEEQCRVVAKSPSAE